MALNTVARATLLALVVALPTSAGAFWGGNWMPWDWFDDDDYYYRPWGYPGYGWGGYPGYYGHPGYGWGGYPGAYGYPGYGWGGYPGYYGHPGYGWGGYPGWGW